MIENLKPVGSLSLTDLQDHPVWQYTNSGGLDETAVRPVKRLPVANLTGKVVGTQVLLANGHPIWALIGNVDANNPLLTEHFLTLSVERHGDWFTLARYHDFDWAEKGPEAIARFLGSSVDEVFPVTYDLRRYAKGDPVALTGQVFKEPRERLSRAQIIAMAVP